MNQMGATRGNGVIAIMIHDESPQALAILESAVLSAFRHLGIPFRLQATGRGIPDGILELCGIDPDAVSVSTFASVETADNSHFLTWTRAVGERVRSDKALEYSVLPQARPGILLASESGHPLVHLAEAGKGRFILFPFDARLYTMEHLGHACGLDDVFLKGVLWAARKPFVTWSMPPFATMAIDDCSGSYNHFRYMETLSAHGWKPNLGLFTDTIDEVAHETLNLDSKRLRELSRSGLADVGFHALRYNESFCFDHLGQRPLTKGELEERFARWDRYEEKWGFKASPWIHPHFGEISLAAMPYFKARGAEFVTHFLPFDAAWFEVPGRKAPLPPEPPYGHNGYFQFLPPQSPDFLSVNCVLEKKTRESPEFVAKADYLWGNTVFWDEAPRTRIPDIAQTISEQARRGIDSGFYGQTLTHEQRIACLKPEEWEEIWQEADRMLGRYALEHRRHSEILAYVKRRRGCALSSVEVRGTDHRVHYEFDSDGAVGTRLQVHSNDDGGGWKTRQHEIRSRVGNLEE